MCWLALVILSKKNALRGSQTAPNQSFADPAEHVMSVLNYGLQNTASACAKMDADFEKIMKACNSMASVREAASKHEDVKEMWAQSMRPVIDAMRDRFSQLEWANEQMVCPEAASDADVNEIQEVLRKIEPTINLTKFTQVELRRMPALKKVLDCHVTSWTYALDIDTWKEGCDCRACELGLFAAYRLPFKPVPPQVLPIPRTCVIDGIGEKLRYLPYEKTKELPITEEHLPSKQKQGPEDEVAARLGIFKTADHVRKTITCSACQRLRCVYASKALKDRKDGYSRLHLEQLRVRLSESYVCGAVLFDDGHPCRELFFVKLSLTCQDPMEAHYYKCAPYTKTNEFVQICSFCTSADGIVPPPADVLEEYSSNLPICKSCLDDGKKRIVGNRRRATKDSNKRSSR